MISNLIRKGVMAVVGLMAATSCYKTNNFPNIIILYSDDLGYGDISCYNPDSKIPTPNIDKLASQGILFTDGHSSCAVSSPSRCAILTGDYHWRHTNRVAGSFTRPLFSKDALTIADILKSSGYYTAAVGKWHLGWDWDSILKPGAELVNNENEWGKYYPPNMIDWSKPIKGGPVEYGFDYYYGNDCPFHPPYTMIENETFLEVPTEVFIHGTFGAKEGDSEMRNGPKAKNWNPYDLFPKLTDKVIELIKNKKKKPLFIYYGIPAPHSPIIPNDEFDGKSKAGAYGDYVVEIDNHVGRIMEALKQAGIYKNTMVIFSSDNGPELYACERMDNFGHNSSTLRGLKRDIYEGGHRVPFIVSWPEAIPAGKVSDEVISQVDLMATFAAIVGYELPNDAGVDSYNLLPLLKDEKYDKPLREATVFNTVRSIYAVRMGDWLYINNYSGSHSGYMKPGSSYYKYFDFVQYDKKNTPGLLFNMKEDIMEKENVYANHPDIVKSIQETLRRYVESGRSVPKRNTIN